MKIALLGAGLMGFPMAERLLQNSYQLIVYNRTISKAEPLKQLGAKIADSASSAIQESDCIILMLTDSEAVNNMLFPNGAILNFSGKTIIQMSTISPTESIEIAQKIKDQNGEFIECPVLGSIPQVKSGELILMVGANENLFNEWKSFLTLFGSNISLVGDVGKASALKLAMNQLIASLTSAFSLSLGFVIQNGIDIDLFMNILRTSALYAPTFDKKLKPMLEHNYSNPNFPYKHLAKDMKLFLNEAEKLSLDTSSLEGVYRVLEKGMGNNKDEDYSSLNSVINPPK